MNRTFAKGFGDLRSATKLIAQASLFNHKNLFFPNYAIVFIIMTPLIKLTFIEGLSEIVIRELASFSSFQIVTIEKDCIYLDFHETLRELFAMKSILNIFLVIQDTHIHPTFLANHKSVLGNLVEQSLIYHPATSFKIFCAGSKSNEISELRNYIETHFKLTNTEETESADKKIIIAKIKNIWELAVSVTHRPLSIRHYRNHHIAGSMNPTIAYAVNQLAHLSEKTSYLNIFSGGGTLPIEAVLICPQLSVTGFDNDKKRITASIHNIRQAGLLKQITIKYADIFNNPNYGIFDIITSDLPFGMLIGKNTNLRKLYETTARYVYNHLENNGTAILYSSESDLLKTSIQENYLTIVQEVPLKIVSSEGAYLYPVIYVCKKSL